MRILVVIGLICGVVSCGGFEGTSERKGSSNPGVIDPAQNGYIVPAVGETAPSSYTMLDTPDANLCVDAFLRQGITLPDNTVARTINVVNVRVGGISIQDMGSSTTPVLNIVRLQNKCSDTTFQFLNPVGFYCIVRNNAVFSNVTIQRKCSAGLAELEPMTHVTVNQPVVKHCGLFGWFCWDRGLDGEGTQTSYNSEIQETQCIP